MELSENERKCLRLLVRWYKENPVIVVGYMRLREELGIDVETCRALIGKMKEIKAVTHDYPPGWLVSEEGAYFRISKSIDKVWQEFLKQQKKEGNED